MPLSTASVTACTRPEPNPSHTAWSPLALMSTQDPPNEHPEQARAVPCASRLTGGDFVPRHRLHHVKRRRVGCGIRAADLSIDADDFGKSLEQLVRLLEHLARLSDADARIGGGHVEQVAFVQRRHELAAELEVRPKYR